MPTTLLDIARTYGLVQSASAKGALPFEANVIPCLFTATRSLDFPMPIAGPVQVVLPLELAPPAP